MPQIQLLDGKKIDFEKSITGFDLTKKISKSLEKIALIMEVDSELKDLSFEINKDSKVRIITSKDKEGLEVIRHDAAHIMAMSVQELFPGTQVTIGPVIENGFYYDFARKEPFTSEDLKKIEVKMAEIIDRDVKTRREVWERKKAISHFKKLGENYKAEIIESIPEKEELSIYHHGETWHGSGYNTSKKHRRSIVSHCVPAHAKFHPTNVGGTGGIYKKYMKLNSLEMDESFFPVIWTQNGRKTF